MQLSVKLLKDFKKPGPPVKELLDCLRDRLNGSMTQDELIEHCYRWSFRYALEDLEYKPKPVKPDFYMRFLMKSEKVRKKVWEEDSIARDKILTYLNSVRSIENMNVANWGWIKEMIKFFDKAKESLKVDELTEIIGGYHG